MSTESIFHRQIVLIGISNLSRYFVLFLTTGTPILYWTVEVILFLLLVKALTSWRNILAYVAFVTFSLIGLKVEIRRTLNVAVLAFVNRASATESINVELYKLVIST